jgi:uncharacterized membrane protein
MKPRNPIERDAHIRHRRVKTVVALLVLTGVALLGWGLYRSSALSAVVAAILFGFSYEFVKVVFGKGDRR